MKKKTILIFIDWFTPGYKAGGPISSNANLITHLSSEFEFYVITRDTDYCETKPYKDIISDNWNDTREGAKVYYLSKKRLSFKNIINIVKKINFDIVYINGIYSLYFSITPLLCFKYFTRKKIVVSARGMLSDHTFSSKKIKKKFFYFLAKLTGLYKGIVMHATNDDEAEQIRKNINFKGIIQVAPNLPPKINTQFSRVVKNSNELKLISIARISPEKNTLFALNILHQFTEKNNVQNVNITFDLYGTVYDEKYWTECRAVIAALPSNIKVNFKGAIEKEKISATLTNYHFLFLPSQGENYGHSIVESFIAGRPVIISNKTPWKNLQNVHTVNSQQPAAKRQQLTANSIGWDIPLEKPEQFVEAIEYCTNMQQDEFDTMSRNGFAYGQTIINDVQLIETYKKVFQFS